MHAVESRRHLMHAVESCRHLMHAVESCRLDQVNAVTKKL